jgi:transcriptional regulator with XRE-family HTH domain
MNQLGEVLRKLRKERGLSLRDVQDRVGISNSYLSQVERGSREPPSPKFLRRLSEAYGVSTEILLRAAGYLDDSRPEQSELDWAFDCVQADEKFSHGHRLSGSTSAKDLPDDVKLMIVRMYEEITNRKLLADRDEEEAG